MEDGDTPSKLNFKGGRGQRFFNKNNSFKIFWSKSVEWLKSERQYAAGEPHLLWKKKKNFFSQWKGEKNFQQSKKPNNLALNEIRVHWREEFSNLAVVELESKCKRPLLKATQISGKNMVDVTLEREKKKLHYNLTQITLNSHWKTNS